jgi:hypothetical protein
MIDRPGAGAGRRLSWPARGPAQDRLPGLGHAVWWWLSEDAIRPSARRSWVFPRDPDFRARPGVVLDLYDRRWEGRRLHPGDSVISADERRSCRRCSGATTR